MTSKPVRDSEIAVTEVIDCTMEEAKVDCISESDFLKDLVQKFFKQATLNVNSQEPAIVPTKKEKTKYLNCQQCQPNVSILNQCSRFPVFKDAANNWRYDYREAEKKRFRGTEVWDSNRIDALQLELYLRCLSSSWPAGSGMTEEIALEYLALHDYDLEGALRESLQQP